MRILFLGQEFPAARETLATLLPDDEIDACPADRIAEWVPGWDVIVPSVWGFKAEWMDLAEDSVVIHQFGVGLDGVDLEAARERGIPVANVPATGGGNAASVAELAVLQLLTLARRLDAARAAVRERKLGEPAGRSLEGMHVAVLGVGAVGRQVLPRLKAFGALTIPLGRVSREELLVNLAETDALVVCLPLTDETRGLIGAAELEAMPHGSLLVNVARGPIVDREALLAALRSGRLAGAGMDVYDSEPVDPDDPLLGENVVATPHIGAATAQAQRAVAEEFAANVERLRRGELLANRVV